MYVHQPHLCAIAVGSWQCARRFSTKLTLFFHRYVLLHGVARNVRPSSICDLFIAIFKFSSTRPRESDLYSGKALHLLLSQARLFQQYNVDII